MTLIVLVVGMVIAAATNNIWVALGTLTIVSIMFWLRINALVSEFERALGLDESKKVDYDD